MPLEIKVTKTDGSEMWYYIAPRIMRAEKAQPAYASNWNVLEDWPWTNESYIFEIDVPLSDLQKVEINPTGRMYEDDVENNVWEK